MVAPPKQDIVGYNPKSKTKYSWLVIAVAVSSALTILLIPEGEYPLAYFRIVLSMIFMGFLPGYVLLRIVMPSKFVDQDNNSFDFIDCTALSLGLSIAITAIVGLILGYSPWGLSLTSITLALLIFTIVLSVVSMLNNKRFLW